MAAVFNAEIHVLYGELDATKLKQLVELYPFLIDTASRESDSKSSKYAETLADLDTFRFTELPAQIGMQMASGSSKCKGSGYLELDDLKRLLEWKMYRGVFRPSLRGLISSNSSDLVKSTTAEAFALLQNQSQKKEFTIDAVIRSSKILCKLKGVGPATASLLLSVAFPTSVPFFADELFAWTTLKHKSQLNELLRKRFPKGPGTGKEGQRVDKIIGIKYTEAEYKTLFSIVSSIRDKLKETDDDISASDIEKAAYVILQGSEFPEILKQSSRNGYAKSDANVDDSIETEKSRKGLRIDEEAQSSTSPTTSDSLKVATTPETKGPNKRPRNAMSSNQSNAQTRSAISKRRKK